MPLAEIYQKGAAMLKERKLDTFLHGVETEYVVRNNEQIFNKYRFWQKSIHGQLATTRTKLLNIELETPIIMSSINEPIPSIVGDGLMKVARALKACGSLMSLGSPMPKNLSQVAEIGVPLVQTFKPLADRTKLYNMISEAEQAGVTWVGIEVDAGQGTKVLERQRFKDCSPISVEELKEIKRKISRPFILKGILSPWDAEKALEAGADIITVSNHGAHSIDYLPHPLEVIDAIKDVIRSKIPIIMDGGFRRGTDVLKALALGAQAVGIGRPILYGLVYNGEAGVSEVVSEMTEELRRTMVMTGVKDPAGANPDILLS